MFVSRYQPKKEGHKFQYSTGKEKDKLFVRGLPYSMFEQDIKEYFEKICPVKEVRLLTRKNGNSKGACYITFNDAATAEKVRLATDGTTLQGLKLMVQISDPSVVKKEANPYV